MPYTKAPMLITTRMTAFRIAPFQLNSWLAIEEARTSTMTDSTMPSGLSSRPNSTTAPRIHSSVLMSQRASWSSTPLDDSDPHRTSAPSMASTMPSQNGKYPGPILAAVPME
ncbi:hypothetical protein D3C81_906820 [compost metagenome]